MAQVARTEARIDARSAFANADYDSCISSLETVRRTADDNVLLMRAYSRSGNNEKALRIFNALVSPRSDALIARADILVRKGDFDGARASLDRAAPIIRRDDVDDLAQCNALLAFAMGETDAAGNILNAIERKSAQAVELLGWIAVRRRDYLGALKLFESALGRATDAWVKAHLLYAASAIGRDLHLPLTMGLVRHHAEHFRWSKYLQVQRFETLRCLAWFTAAEGQWREAFRMLRNARASRAGPPWQVAYFVERAYFSMMLGERENANSYIEEALDLAGTIDWRETKGEERETLLYLANLAAERNVLAARRLLKIYFSLEPTAPLTEWSRDPRVTALEYFAIGSVERAEGNTQASAKAFNEAFSIYRDVGYHWRAVLTLLARGWSANGVTLHSDQDGYYAYIEHVLSKHPHSLIRKHVEQQVRRLKLSPVLANLTSMQRTVLRGVLEGKTNKEIARDLDRGERTVRDHVADLIRRAQVRTRTDLVRYCAMHGSLDI